MLNLFHFCCGLFLSLLTPITILSQNRMCAKDDSITVFVHGTFPARRMLHYSPGRFLVYCPQGLSLAKDLPKKYHFHKMAQGCVELNSDMYSLDQFYVFGWKSEQVYNHVRMQAAADLVQEIQTCVEKYYKDHKRIPKIRLIGFSHGGNVVLNTAHFLPLKIKKQIIDVEIWILGTPVQEVNKDLVNSTYFSKVYSFFSRKDWLQRMDPQGLWDAKIRKNHFWSDRMFASDDRCIQIDFTVNEKPISHSYYRSILKYFPLLQKEAEEKSQGQFFGFISINLKK